MKHFFKSAWAVIAGFILVFILSVETDVVLQKMGVFPTAPTPFTNSHLFLSFIYRTLYAVMGAYLTAWLAPKKPMKHAMILGWVGLFLSTLGAILGWELGAHWYPILLIISALPSAWLGGRLYLRKKKIKDCNCESCLMPFDKDPGIRESDTYCSLCFKNGKLCYEGNDLEEFKEGAYQNMRRRGMNNLQAKFFTWMIGFAPRWKKGKKKNSFSPHSK